MAEKKNMLTKSEVDLIEKLGEPGSLEDMVRRTESEAGYVDFMKRKIRAVQKILPGRPIVAEYQYRRTKSLPSVFPDFKDITF